MWLAPSAEACRGSTTAPRAPSAAALTPAPQPKAPEEAREAREALLASLSERERALLERAVVQLGALAKAMRPGGHEAEARRELEALEDALRRGGIAIELEQAGGGIPLDASAPQPPPPEHASEPRAVSSIMSGI